MSPNPFKNLAAGAGALAVLTLFPTPAASDPGILLSPSICDNQAEAFAYVWKNANVQNLKMFFIAGNNALNGAIHAVGHANAFNASADVYVVAHSDVRIVGAFSANDFATVFVNAHQTVPDSVTFYACQSGTPTNQAPSSMATLARAYPGQAQNSTLIDAVTAPGANTCPAQRGPAAAQGQPIQNIAAATMSTGVQHTNAYAGLLQTLLTQWAGGGVTYPNTQNTFQQECLHQLGQDATGQWVPGFITAVDNQFGAQYLSLINANYNGNALVTCGAANGVQCN